MSFSRRIRNIARSQLEALKDRLDRIDEEAEAGVAERRAEADARRELIDELRDPGPSLRSPEEIMRGSSGADRTTVAPQQAPSPQPRSAAPATAPASALAKAYRVLGLPDGADLSDVEAAHSALAARCAPDRFVDGSDEQRTAEEILARVEAAYDELRDALDPTAGRFDKLEL